MLKKQYARIEASGYTVSIVQTGWHNMDRYTAISSSDYASPQSAIFRIGNVKQYDGVYEQFPSERDGAKMAH